MRVREEATVRVISIVDNAAVNIRQGDTDEAGQTSALIHDNSISTRQKIANYTFAQTMVSNNQDVGIGMSSSRNCNACPNLKTESSWINPVTVVLLARAGCNLGGISCGVFIGRFGGRFVFVRCNSTS